MSLKKLSLVFSGSLLVLAVVLLVNLTVSGIKLKNIEEANKVCVVIDAGHGGFDGGAVATDGTLEKDINLQIASKLDEACRIFGLKTRMVRTTDASTEDAGTTANKKRSDLNNRLKIMKEEENCVFVSIHQNEFSTSQPNGAQVFYAPKVTGSEQLADSIQTALKNHIQNNNKRVIKAGTSSAFLLYYAVRPAVIVECGFMSNPQDLKNLKDAEYQQRLAFAIATGISNYCFA
ncbi:MAG: N-acetylmuramoyl-L-alanine amidase [Clostridia bacterium]|nr:N-acetylmuramoyl-L-alanine amidase [Clostridia bacterium]